MLFLPPAATLHLERESRRLTVAGVVYKRDGSTLRCTQHDEDLDIEGGDLEGLYLANAPVTASDIKSSSDMSVDNLEIDGIIDDRLNFSGFTVRDIEAGQFTNAPFETFLCQWDAPSAWQKTLRRGYLGELSRTSEGQFKAEWRGLMQYAQQTIGRTYAELCDVKRFGDSRCGLDVGALEQHVTINSVTSRRRFQVTVTADPAFANAYFDLGEAIFTGGANAGRAGQIKRGAASTLGDIELWEAMPFEIAPGDAVTMRPGCDRRFSSCQKFGNFKRFRGDGFWIPGIPNIIRAP
jgi:uncharacterized phage protein (TIGR02218 family)